MMISVITLSSEDVLTTSLVVDKEGENRAKDYFTKDLSDLYKKPEA